MCSQWSSKQRIRLNLPISAFYPHFSVLSPFQRFIPISVSAFSFRFRDSVSAFYPYPIWQLLKIPFKKCFRLYQGRASPPASNSNAQFFSIEISAYWTIFNCLLVIVRKFAWQNFGLCNEVDDLREAI